MYVWSMIDDYGKQQMGTPPFPTHVASSTNDCCLYFLARGLFFLFFMSSVAARDGGVICKYTWRSRAALV